MEEVSGVKTHLWSRNRFLRLFGSQLFHGIVVLFLLLCHKDVLTSKVKGHTDMVIILYVFYLCLLIKVSNTQSIHRMIKKECVLSFSFAG